MLPAEHKFLHHQKDLRELSLVKYDFVFAFPPCTYLCKAQYSLHPSQPERKKLTMSAAEFVKWIIQNSPNSYAIENPIGYLPKVIGNPQQIVRPFFFGDPYSKDICLWLKNCPPLMSTCINPVRKSISNHVNGRMSQAEKSNIRSSWNYFPGMCNAIASQWFPKV